MTLELVETARFCVYARRDARERWFGRSVARFTEMRSPVTSRSTTSLVSPMKKEMKLRPSNHTQPQTVTHKRTESVKHPLGTR